MELDLNTILHFISSTFLMIGAFLCISGGIGVLRFPDFYTRMHAVGVTDTLAAGMILIGLMLISPEAIVLIKLIMIFLMTLFINPTASHALAKAAMKNDLLPILSNDEPNIVEKNDEEHKSSNQ
jgi:multicomponent Na+:H+ antiporter subunit G